jgi:hypothetical protein
MELTVSLFDLFPWFAGVFSCGALLSYLLFSR